MSIRRSEREEERESGEREMGVGSVRCGSV